MNPAPGASRANSPGWFPFGWYVTPELPPHDTHRVGRFVAFGREWLNTREPAAVSSPRCQHDGAPLWRKPAPARGQLRCPRCGRPPAADGLPVGVWAGRTWFWWHPGGDAPHWELPPDPVPVAAWHWSSYPIHTTWMDIAENSVDWAHFSTIHAPATTPVVLEDRWVGPIRHIRSLQRMPTLDGSDGTTEVHSTAHGPGLLLSTLRVAGLLDAMLITSVVPRGATEVTVHVGLSTQPAGPGRAHTPGAASTTLLTSLSRQFFRAVHVQMEQDAAIWNHKVWLSDPLLAPGENGILKIRRDLERFRAPEPGATRTSRP